MRQKHLHPADVCQMVLASQLVGSDLIEGYSVERRTGLRGGA